MKLWAQRGQVSGKSGGSNSSNIWLGRGDCQHSLHYASVEEKERCGLFFRGAPTFAFVSFPKDPVIAWQWFALRMLPWSTVHSCLYFSGEGVYYITLFGESKG